MANWRTWKLLKYCRAEWARSAGRFSLWTAALLGSCRVAVWLNPPGWISLSGNLPSLFLQNVGLGALQGPAQEKFTWPSSLLHVTAKKGATLAVKCVHLLRAKWFVGRTQLLCPRTSGEASDKAASLIKLLCAQSAHFRMQQEEPTRRKPHLIWPRHSQGS